MSCNCESVTVRCNKCKFWTFILYAYNWDAYGYCTVQKCETFEYGHCEQGVSRE